MSAPVSLVLEPRDRLEGQPQMQTQCQPGSFRLTDRIPQLCSRYGYSPPAGSQLNLSYIADGNLCRFTEVEAVQAAVTTRMTPRSSPRCSRPASRASICTLTAPCTS
jgi:hypothetical protein